MCAWNKPGRRPVRNERRTVRKARRMARKLFRRTLLLALNREVRLFLVIFLGYFLQVTFVATLSEYVGVSLMLTLSVIAVITVCYGRVRAFWCGLIYGMLMELMLPGTPLMNLFLYPASALLWSVPFSDKSAQQMEYERSIGKAGRNRNPYIRTLLCALVNSLTYEGVNITYIYLRESLVTSAHVFTGLRNALATMLLTLVIMMPLRAFFGYRPQKQEVEPIRPYGDPAAY